MENKAVILNKATQMEVAKVSKSILTVPVLREKLNSHLTGEIKEDKVTEILKKPDKLKELSEDEILIFIGGLYKTTLSEKLNPATVFLSSKDIKIKKEMYNEDFKEEFISGYKESTQRVLRILFKKTSILERAYNKDLYDFELEEFREVLKSLEAKTIRSLQNNALKLRKYINFAIDKKVTKNDVNYADIFNNAGRLEEFLSVKADDMVFSRQEIMSMALNADNAQDGAIIAILFDGANNKNQFHELVNLRKEHIDFSEQKATLFNPNGESRTIDLSTETCILLKQAIDQEEYISINGDGYRKYKVCDSDYVFRGLRDNAQVKWRNINERIARIAKSNEEEINATNIVYSGELHFLNTKLNEMDSDEDTHDAYVKTLEKFGLPVNESSLHSLKKRYEKFKNKL